MNTHREGGGTVRAFQTIGALAGHTVGRISLNHLRNYMDGARHLMKVMILQGRGQNRRLAMEVIATQDQAAARDT